MHSSFVTGSAGAGGSGEMNFIINPPATGELAVVAVAENAKMRFVVHSASSPSHASFRTLADAILVLITSTRTFAPAGCTYSCVNGMQRSKSAGVPATVPGDTSMSPAKTSVGADE